MNSQVHPILDLVQRTTRFDGEIKLSMGGNQADLLIREEDGSAMFYVAVDEGELSIEAYVVINNKGQHTFCSVPYSSHRIVVIDDEDAGDIYYGEELEEQFEEMIVKYRIESGRGFIQTGVCKAMYDFCRKAAC